MLVYFSRWRQAAPMTSFFLYSRSKSKSMEQYKFLLLPVLPECTYPLSRAGLGARPLHQNRGIPVAVRLFLGIIAGCHSSHIFVSPGTEGGKPVYFHWSVIGARITSAPFNIRILALSGNSRCKNPSRKKELSPGQNRRCGLWNNELLLFPDGQKP